MNLDGMKKLVVWNISLTGLIGCVLIGLVCMMWVWGWSLPLAPSQGQDGVDFAVQSSGEGIVMMAVSVISIGVAFVFFLISLSCYFYYRRLCVKGSFGDAGVTIQALISLVSIIGMIFFVFLFL